MVEGDHLASNLLEKVAGKPREPQPLSLVQEAVLSWWDNEELPRIFTLMEKDKEYKIQHKEWEKRQFNQ